MLAKISGALACAVLMTGLSQPTFARGKTNTANTASVTGCLTQGDEPNEYAVKATEDGKAYGLKSSKVDLAQHLNHKVTVTGAVSQKEKTKVSKSGKPEEDAHMKVTNLKMVSTNCQ
jgi:hypothetical protein